MKQTPAAEILQTFYSKLKPALREQFEIWEHPGAIQAYLDSIPYSVEDLNRCPLHVLEDSQAHCLDGAVLAAAGLRRLGYKPILVDMQPDPGCDDDHVLAVFQRNKCFGALAKSNFVGLRYREPVYRSLRELVMSYFDVFFNINGKKTLRYYTAPLDLSRLDSRGWMWNDSGVDEIEYRLANRHRYPVVSLEMADELLAMDERSYAAHMSGTNLDGVYRPLE